MTNGLPKLCTYCKTRFVFNNDVHHIQYSIFVEKMQWKKLYILVSNISIKWDKQKSKRCFQESSKSSLLRRYLHLSRLFRLLGNSEILHFITTNYHRPHLIFQNRFIYFLLKNAHPFFPNPKKSTGNCWEIAEEVKSNYDIFINRMLWVSSLIELSIHKNVKLESKKYTHLGIYYILTWLLAVPRKADNIIKQITIFLSLLGIEKMSNLLYFAHQL